jgi:CheY-like chemotaxis protein
MRAEHITAKLIMQDTRIPPILLVEEDATLSEITAFRLELLGYDVTPCQSAEQALQWLEEHLPSIVIVDTTLPGMDGIEFINRLSNDLRTSEIPVMVISTNSDLDEVQKAYTAGADEFLVIPYDPLVLETKVERLTGGVAASGAR